MIHFFILDHSDKPTEITIISGLRKCAALCTPSIVSYNIRQHVDTVLVAYLQISILYNILFQFE